MILVLTESAGKAASVRRLLDKSAPGQFMVGFTSGKLYDLPWKGHHWEWQEVKPEAIAIIKGMIEKASAVVAMTDPDEQGELIAHQIHSMCGDRPFGRAITRHISADELIRSLSDVKEVNRHIVSKVMVARYMDHALAIESARMGFGRAGLVSMLTAAALSNANGRMELRTELLSDGLESRAVQYVAPQGSATKIELTSEASAPDYRTVLRDCITKGSVTATEFATEMQQAMEHGHISYARTNDTKWHPDAIHHVESFVEGAGLHFSAAALLRNAATDVEHSAIYQLGSAWPGVVSSALARRTFAAAGVTPRSAAPWAAILNIQGGKPISLIADQERHPVARQVRTATPEQSVLYCIELAGIARASTIAAHTARLAERFFGVDGSSGGRELNSLCGLAMRIAPGLLKGPERLAEVAAEIASERELAKINPDIMANDRQMENATRELAAKIGEKSFDMNPSSFGL